MKKKIPPLNFPNKRPPRPIEIHTGYSNLPKEEKQIVKRRQMDKIRFFPAFGKRPSSCKIDANTEDDEWNSFIILHDTKEFVLPSSSSL